MFQQILLDIHEARKQVEDLKEIGASSEDDMKKLKESVVERAECAANKLDKVHDYLMLAFDNKMEIVLHKAQVSLNNFFCILKFRFLIFENKNKKRQALEKERERYCIEICFNISVWRQRIFIGEASRCSYQEDFELSGLQGTLQ